MCLVIHINTTKYSKFTIIMVNIDLEYRLQTIDVFNQRAVIEFT